MEARTLKIVVSDRVNDAPEPLRVFVCETVTVSSGSYKEEKREITPTSPVLVYISADHFSMPSITLNWPPLMARAPSVNFYSGAYHKPSTVA
jgi:hypothetical protein